MRHRERPLSTHSCHKPYCINMHNCIYRCMNSCRDPWRLRLCRRRIDAPYRRPSGDGGRRARSAHRAPAKPVAALHPHLALAYPDVAFEAWDAALLNGCDLIFAALPHGESQRLADDLLAPGIAVRRPRRRLPPRQRRRVSSAGTASRTCAARPARQLRLRPSRIPPRQARRSQTRRRAGLLSDRRQPGAEAAGRRRRGRARRDHRRCRLGRQRRRARRAGTHYCAVDGNFRAYGLTQPSPHRRNADDARAARCCSRRTSCR